MANQNYLSKEIDDDGVSITLKALKEYEVENKEANVIYLFKVNGYQVKIYSGRKGYTLTIIGENPSDFFDEYLHELKRWEDEGNQIGADEVGVGEFLLPLVCVATYIKAEDIPYIDSLNIRDSKKMSDSAIIRAAENIITRVDYKVLVCTNERYNQLIDEGENAHSIKAKMHNQILFAMQVKHPEAKNIYLDQFVAPTKYYEYLKDDDALVGITFLTKSENKYPSVAVSSVIARYTLLKEKEKLEKELGLPLAFGAGSKADTMAKGIVDKYGLATLKKYCKCSFANYKNLAE
ncbi:MAG: ribonuclease HIII [Coprobacillus sp.]|nr:ribonuclease HIII [Coprobacillus sp.]